MANEQRNLDSEKRAICCRCGMAGVVVILPAANLFYCLQCLQDAAPVIYQQLKNWIDDHQPRKP